MSQLRQIPRSGTSLFASFSNCRASFRGESS
nr:hypothetical protein [Microcystis sp. LSC13-02]